MSDAEFDELPAFEPLTVHCGDSKCDSDLHCFRPNRRKKNWAKTYEGACEACGRKLIDWDRVRARDIADVQGVFKELQYEFIRHGYFHAPFDEASRAEARALGLLGLKKAVRPLLQKKIGPAKIFRDGTQTKKLGSALFFAQHATATCCRKCLEYWHGVERERELTAAELDYCEGLVSAYLELRAEELFLDEEEAAAAPAT